MEQQNLISMNTNDIIKNVIIVILAVLTSFFGCSGANLKMENNALKREVKGLNIRIDNYKKNATADKLVIMWQEQEIKRLIKE